MKENKRDEQLKIFHTPEVVILLVIVAVVSVVASSLVCYRFLSDKNGTNYAKVDSNLQTFAETYQYIIDNYYGDLNKKDLINSAIAGMLTSLDDPYSVYLDPNSSNNFNVTLEGSFQGVGIEIINDNDYNVIIYSVLNNSPAQEAGLKAGDIIKKIDDQEISGKKTSEIVTIIQNSKKEQFTIVVDRHGEEKTFTVSKKKVEIQSVASDMFEENGKKIGYLQVSIFANNTYQQFKQALEDLESKGMNSLIIDLRENGGGHLTAVQQMMELFLDSSHVIYQTESKEETVKIYSRGKETKTYPIAILVNGNTASASEVMTATLQEEYGAIVVGETTFGKGTVQQLQDLNSGGQFKMTTKKWLTPNGTWINGQGIKPDVEIKLDDKYYEHSIKENDNQLKKAIEILKVK